MPYYIFNEDYYLKNDVKRIILYSHSELKNNSSKDWGSFIHPLHAKLLNIFNQPIRIEEAVNKALGIIPNIGKSKLKEIINSFTANNMPFYVEWNGCQIKFPKNLIIRSNNNSINRKEIDLSYFNGIKQIDLTTKRLYSSPLDIIYMLTNKCFVNCAYCYADRNTKSNDINFEVFLDFVRQAKALNVRYIDLIGGDILRKKNWDMYLKFLINNGFSPRFISTKKVVTEDDINKLINCNYKNEIQFSLDTLNSINSKKLLAVNSNYISDVVTSLTLLDKSGLKLRINTVISSLNIDKSDLISICNLLNKLENIVEWEIRLFMPSLYLSRKTNSILKVNDKNVKILKEFIQNELALYCKHKILYFDNTQFNPTTNLSCNKELEWRCSANISSFFILPDGKVTICEQLYWNDKFIIGDISKETIEEIWNSEKAILLSDIYSKIQCQKGACVKCKDNKNCFTKAKRCWVNVLKYNGKDNWLDPDPLCNKYFNNKYSKIETL